MVAESPEKALGAHTSGVRDELVEIVRSAHDRFAEAHAVSGSRYGMGFASQWRDLLDDAHHVVTRHGFQTHKLSPAGHKIPVVNGCLVYVWRVPNDPAAVSKFASSPTRRSSFSAPPPDAMLFEPVFGKDQESTGAEVETAETESMLEAVRSTMPVVLVMVRSTPRQLQSIEWAVADLDVDGLVTLHGRETIWEPEMIAAGARSNVEPFSAGDPIEPVIEPREQEATDPDAR